MNLATLLVSVSILAAAATPAERTAYRTACAPQIEQVRDFHLKAGATRAQIEAGIDQVIGEVLEYTDPAPIRDYINGFFDQTSDPMVKIEGDMWICFGRERLKRLR